MSGISTGQPLKEEVARFFTGLHLVEPGIQPSHRWHPDSDDGTARIGSVEIKDADVAT